MDQITENVKNNRKIIFRWSIVLSIAGIIIYVSYFVSPSSRLPITYPYLYPYPWIVAGGLVIIQGIQQFSNHATTNDPLLFLYQPGIVLYELVVGFVIAPTLFFLGWRAVILKECSKIVSYLFFVVGGSIVLAIALPAISDALVRHTRNEERKKELSMKSERDSLDYDLRKLGFCAAIYWNSAKEAGGGGKSFLGYKLKDSVDIDGNRFRITSLDSHLITFMAISHAYPGAYIRIGYDSLGYQHGPAEYGGIFKEERVSESLQKL